LEVLDQLGRRGADRTDDRSALNHPPILQLDPEPGYCRRRRIEHDIDSGPTHRAIGIGAKLGGGLGENVIARVNDRHLDVVRADRGIERAAVSDRIVDLAGPFDSAEAAATHYEAQEPPPPSVVIASFGALQAVDPLRPERQRVADRLEREAMIAHAGNESEIDR